MANSLARLLLSGLLVAAGAGAQSRDEPKEITLAMDSIDIDGATNLMRLGRPRITQDGMSIEADEALATSTDFDERSEWRFTGRVRVALDNAVLEATSAVFTVDQGRLARGELEGVPASFTHADPARQKPISGTAAKMSYDSVARTLRMTDAWLQRDQSEFTACDLIYNFTTQGFSSGDANCENPLRMRFVPDPDQQDEANSPQ
jgi:lipopolysaccharide transport protein LptA